MAEGGEDRELLPLAERHAFDARTAVHSPSTAQVVDERGVPTGIEGLCQLQLIPSRERIDQLVLLRNEPDPRLDVAGQTETVAPEDSHASLVHWTESEDQLEQSGLA